MDPNTPQRPSPDSLGDPVPPALDEATQRTTAPTQQDAEEQFRRAVEEAPIPMIMHAEDGEVLQISRSWTELTGYTLADVPTLDAWLNHAYGDGAARCALTSTTSLRAPNAV
jgi:PAS domain-containing protein